MYLATMPRIRTKATNSAMKVALGTKKLLDATTVDECAMTRLPFYFLGEDEDEQHGEGQVDEVHRLDQTDRQEEQRPQATFCLGLAGQAGDQRATGETVTDRRANRRSTEGHPATDEGAGELDGLRVYCSHFFSSIPLMTIA